MNHVALTAYALRSFIDICQNGLSSCGLAVHLFLLCAGLVIANKLHPSEGLDEENLYIYRDCGKNCCRSFSEVQGSTEG